MLEVLCDHQDHFLDRHSLDSLLSGLREFLKLQEYAEFISLLKYHIQNLHARSLTGKYAGGVIHQVLPDSPEFPFREQLFSGSVGRFLRSRMISKDRLGQPWKKNQHLFWSLSQVKRAAETVPESFVNKALQKHRKTMETPSGPTSQPYLDSIRSKLKNIWRGISPQRVLSVHEYSTNACWESSRDEGGAKGYLLYDHVREGLVSNDEMLKMSYDPVKGVMEDRGFAPVSILDLVAGEDRRVKSNLAQGLYTGCQAGVYPVCEPLKVRTITKGNAFAYALAHGLQKAMHSHLKRSHQFQLIGEPVTRLRAIEWLTEKSPRGLWVSGDYSGATDLIKIELTKMAFETILTEVNLGERYNTVLRRVLYEHEIHYPKKSGPDGGDLAPVMQVNGQLMGSVLSFPILCAINLAHYWHTVEPEVTDFRQLKALVNGDDILFRTEPAQYRNWYDNLHEAGFVPSPGKNFVHPKFFTINSQLFSGPQGGKLPEKIPFFNTGLLYGQSKVGAREDELAKPVYLLHNPCVEGALNKKRASQRFLAINRHEMEQSSSHFGVQLNYFIAPELGGLGLHPPPGTKITMNPGHLQPHTVHISPLQRKLAEYLYEKWTEWYDKPIAGRAGSPEKENDYDSYEGALVSTGWCFDDACASVQLEIDHDLSPLSAELGTRKRYPPVMKRQVRRLVETKETFIPLSRVVLPTASGGVNWKLNELSDKDLTKLNYRWKLPTWRKATRSLSTISLSPSSLCHKSFLEVTGAPEDLCIPEHFCY